MDSPQNLWITPASVDSLSSENSLYHPWTPPSSVKSSIICEQLHHPWISPSSVDISLIRGRLPHPWAASLFPLLASRISALAKSPALSPSPHPISQDAPLALPSTHTQASTGAHMALPEPPGLSGTLSQPAASIRARGPHPCPQVVYTAGRVSLFKIQVMQSSPGQMLQRPQHR